MMIKTLILCLLIFGSISTAADEGGLRDWTNAAGKTISAELIALEGDDVTLKLADGKEYEISLTTLSEADGEFARQWQKDQEAAARMEAAGIKLGVPTEVSVENAFDKDTPRTRKSELAGGKPAIG